MVPPAQSTLADHTATTATTATPVEPPGHVAELMRPLVEGRLGLELPLRLEFWDGSALGPDQPLATLRFNSPDAFRRLLWMPNELGLAVPTSRATSTSTGRSSM